MANFPVIDADGHLIEQTDLLRSYLKPPYDKRSGPLFTANRGWPPAELSCNRDWCRRDLKAADCFRSWISTTWNWLLYSTGAGDVSECANPAMRLGSAALTMTTFTITGQSLRPFEAGGTVPSAGSSRSGQRNPARRQRTGLRRASTKTVGLQLPLGHRFYDPIYKEAQDLGCVIGVHGTRNGAHELGAGMFDTFAEVHTVAFPVGIFQQFTSMIFQGVLERFPKLRVAFLEIGCTWLPYWLDRMDEHWEKRGKIETPI
jgi:hypothetical protein